MRTRYEHDGLVWIDLESPSRDEVQDIVDQFAIDPGVADDLLLPSTKPRVDLYPGYAYLVLHFPALRHSHRSREQEVDFIIGERFLITTRYDTIDPLHKLSKVFEVNTLLDKSTIGQHGGDLFFSVLKKLYRSIDHELEFIRHDIAVIEEHIFAGHEVQMVSAISKASRDLLNLRQVIEPHREVLREFEVSGTRLFGEAFGPSLRALSDEYYRVHNHIMRQTESLHELRETNNSLLTTKQNETMKVLTVMAFITLPLSLIASIFEMNTRATPIVGTPYDFWIILGLMAGIAVTMLLYFKHRNWL